MDVLTNLVGGFQTALSLQNIYLCFLGCLWGSMVGVLRNRPLGRHCSSDTGYVWTRCYRSNNHAGRNLLWGHVWGFHNFHFDEYPRRIRFNRNVSRWLPDDSQRPGRRRPFYRSMGVMGGGDSRHRGHNVSCPSLGKSGHEIRPFRNVCSAFGGLFFAGSLGTGSFIKTMAMVILGLLLGTVGMDSLTGTLRFTFGIHDLYDGIRVCPRSHGRFWIWRNTLLHRRKHGSRGIQTSISELLPNRKELRASWAPILRGSGIGFLIGLLPGSLGETDKVEEIKKNL